MRNTLVTTSLLFSIALAACGSQVPQDTVDQNQTISRLNAQKNADSYRLQAFPDSARALFQSDSTISQSCRYGDGWASGVVEFTEGPRAGRQIKVKCQTNGTGKGINGCMTEQEFLGKDYKSQEGSCQNLTNLEKFK